jgi:hypothetical protein
MDNFRPSDDFRPRTSVMLSYRLVLHPDVLRPVVLSSYILPCTSYLFIQHLFDFRAIFVCHGSFPTTHFILQIVRCVRIL